MIQFLRFSFLINRLKQSSIIFYQLSIIKKVEILSQNIFGTDFVSLGKIHYICLIKLKSWQKS